MKAIFFNFIYTFICVLTLCLLTSFNNLWLIIFSFILGDLSAFVYLYFKEANNGTKS